MSESFVDLSYRGLSLGRRIKLTHVEAASGYLETPAPMPVGTAIAIATDDGVTVEAIVTEVHEQVGGVTAAPGMQVAPKLEGDASAWWSARVNDAVPEPAPEEPTVATAPVVEATPAPAARPERMTVRPRSHTVQTPPPEWQADLGKAAAAVAESLGAVPEPTQDSGATTVMPAVDPALYADDSRATMPQMAIVDDTRTTQPQMAIAEPRVSGAYAIVDDGKRTIAMSVVDPTALGLVAPDEEASVPVAVEDKKPSGGTKKRRKKRG
jgi:hypothetical protein